MRLDKSILTVSYVERSLAFYEAALMPLNIRFFLPYKGEHGHPDLWGFGDGVRACFWLKQGSSQKLTNTVNFCRSWIWKQGVLGLYQRRSAMTFGNHAVGLHIFPLRITGGVSGGRTCLFAEFLHARRTRSALADVAVAKAVTPIHPQRASAMPPSVEPEAMPTNMQVKSKALARLRASGAMLKTIV